MTKLSLLFRIQLNWEIIVGFTESILFLDANVYLHFRYIEIDWKRITASEQVRIIVPRVTVSELDKNKYDPRRRTRATSILNTFEKASSSTGTSRSDLE